jgi:RNase P/RNase MRP subunit POP5
MSKRARKRYLALRVSTEQPVNQRKVINAVWGAVLRLFGEYGASQANLTLIEYNPQRNYAVIGCSHKALEKVRASIASITRIDEIPARFHVVGVSGTLRALHSKILM